MEYEFIYWPHPTPVGIRVEEVSGMESKSGKLWVEMAKQIFAENGRDNYREFGHFSNGAPFIFGTAARISVTHSGHLLAVASLPKTPEADLSTFNQRTALGIDTERLDREQVLKVRDKFLSNAEKQFIEPDNLESNILAWTAKEALYKAAMTEGLDFCNDITILSLPCIDTQMNLPGAPAPVIGKARISIPVIKKNPDETETSAVQTFDMELYSYESDGYCVTIAYSPKCAKFSRR